jgi:hypothetical protein
MVAMIEEKEVWRLSLQRVQGRALALPSRLSTFTPNVSQCVAGPSLSCVNGSTNLSPFCEGIRTFLPSGHGAWQDDRSRHGPAWPLIERC